MVVTVKATHIVLPSEPSPDNVMHLDAGDQIKDITHTQTIYFYKNSPALQTLDPLAVLKSSLSKALVIFYPLAGRLTWDPQGGSRVQLHCNGKGVPIYEAESDARIEDFDDFTPTPAIDSFIPSFDYTTPIEEIPLVIVQLTRFACGGVSIGLGISHVMADGPSALHFVDEWAKIARDRGEDVVFPYLDRTVFESDKPLGVAFEYPKVLLKPPTLIGDEDSSEQKKKPIDLALLNLSQLQIEKLRSKANMDLEDDTIRGYSRFEAVAAHIWRCTSKARAHLPEQETRLTFVADFRNKLEPPLPRNYFGNALIRVDATDTSGHLLSSSLGSASKKIREAVEEKVTDGTVRAYLDFLKGLPDVGMFRALDSNGKPKGVFYGNPNLGIISWMGLPLYGVDFGWGKEIHMGPSSMGLDGKILLIPSHEGDGSLDVLVWLQEEYLNNFKKCLHDDI